MHSPSTFFLGDANINVSGDKVAQNLMRLCGWFCSPELNPRLATIFCRTFTFCESCSDFILSTLGNDSVQQGERAVTAVSRVELSQGLARNLLGTKSGWHSVPCPAARARSWKELAKLLPGLLCKHHVFRPGPGRQEDGSSVQVAIKHQIA